jgi:DNA-binding HxlR family transcriptional regulator/putative sterol carrier protein
VTAKRRYEDDGCAAAHALDLIGERWALLVARELLLGPKRFSDLESTLPHISPNVLSQRLRDLEALGALRRHKLPPPAASWVYELTEWGMELEPVLQQLGRWGARSPALPRGSPISLATLVTAMKTMFYPPAAHELDATLELRIGTDFFVVRVFNEEFEIAPGRATRPDVILEADVATFGALAFAGLSVTDAVTSGQVRLEGDVGVARRFSRLFRLPEPVVLTPKP